jgi:hypothetical protein
MVGNGYTITNGFATLILTSNTEQAREEANRIVAFNLRRVEARRLAEETSNELQVVNVSASSWALLPKALDTEQAQELYLNEDSSHIINDLRIHSHHNSNLLYSFVDGIMTTTGNPTEKLANSQTNAEKELLKLLAVNISGEILPPDSVKTWKHTLNRDYFDEVRIGTDYIIMIQFTHIIKEVPFETVKIDNLNYFPNKGPWQCMLYQTGCKPTRVNVQTLDFAYKLQAAWAKNIITVLKKDNYFNP